MIRKFILFFTLLCASIPCSAFLKITLEQNKNFVEGSFDKIFNAYDSISGGKIADTDIMAEDKALISFYYILAKNATGFYYTLGNDPAIKFIRDGLGDDHYMTLLTDAIIDPEIYQRHVSCEQAISYIEDTLGEDCWEYAYAHYILANSLLAIEKPEEAMTAVDKAIELNNNNDMPRSWIQQHAMSLKATISLSLPPVDFNMINNVWDDILTQSIMGAEYVNLLRAIQLIHFYVMINSRTNAVVLCQTISRWIDSIGLSDTEIDYIVQHYYAIALYREQRYNEAYKTMLKVKKCYKRLGMSKTIIAVSLDDWIKAIESKL